jgi:hypothetical protein
MITGWRQAAAVAAVAALGWIVLAQGWRSRNPDWDVTHAMVQAVALVQHGAIPQRENLTDYNSFFPPGTTWLTVPGVLLFDDPRLVELFATTLLYALTIAGIVLVGRRYFSARVALLAGALYAFSYVGLRLGTELWPRGHPVFYIWIVYFAGRWIDRRSGWDLAAALLVASTGLYVHLELAPALLIVPALWIVHRPPIQWRAIAAAAVIAIVTWLPYLSFESARSFIDVKSQVLRQSIDERGDEIFGCGHVVTATPRLVPGDASANASISDRASAIGDLLLANLQSRVLAGELLLFTLLIAGMVRIFAPAQRAVLPIRTALVAVVAAIAIAMIVTELSLRWLAAPGSSAAAWLADARRASVWLILATGVFAIRRNQSPSTPAARVVGVALIVPWLILLALTEPGRSERLFGVWPLQSLVIAAAVVAAIDRIDARGARRWMIYGVTVSLVAANLTLLARVRDWTANGWSGRAVPALAANFKQIDCP